MSGPALRVESLEVRYSGTVALQDVCFEVSPGEIFGIIGPNGAGKSTLLRTLVGLQAPDRGRVLLGGVDVTGLTFRRRSLAGISLTFQIPRFPPTLTVGEALLAQSRGFRHTRWGSRDPIARMSEVLGQLELDDSLGSRLDQLTLGEERRFELARALINRPGVVLADEPSSGMSAAEARTLMNALRAVGELGVAVLVVEHNIPLIANMTERTFVLDAGRQLLTGPTKDVLASTVLKEAYLGIATS